MVSPASLRVGIVLLAAVAATPAGFSQSRFGAGAERQRQVIERIQQEESRNGPYSAGLIGPLSDLALIYQDRGDHDLAVAVIDRVRQVVRANEGLHSLEQIPLIQQMIANEEAIGRVDSAWELEQDLLTLARRHPDDIRTVSVFRETAAKRMALLHRYLAGEFPPQMVLGCYYGWPRYHADPANVAVRVPTPTSCTSGTRDDAIRAIISDAQRHYADAIAVMIRNELYSSDELQELELELVRSFDFDAVAGETREYRRRRNVGLGGAQLDAEPWRSWMDSMALLAEWELGQPVADPALEQSAPRDGEPLSNHFYERGCLDSCLGRLSLQRMLAYEIASSAPFEEQVKAFVRLADWEGDEPALEKYKRALRMLQEAGAQALIDELFSPKTPVVLPTFEPNPLASDATDASAGYIDVAFEISDGAARRVHILDTTTNATRADEKRLVELILRSHYRPRLTDGEFGRVSPVVLRYYLSE